MVMRALSASPGLGCVQRGVGGRGRDAEALDVDALGRDAGGQQRRLDFVVHAVRAADEDLVDAAPAPGGRKSAILSRSMQARR